jgi:hypothetical protein
MAKVKQPNPYSSLLDEKPAGLNIFWPKIGHFEQKLPKIRQFRAKGTASAPHQAIY